MATPSLNNPTLRMAELSLGRPVGNCEYSSYIAEVVLPHAVGVVRSSTNPDTHATLPTSATDQFIGVVTNVKEHSTSTFLGADEFSYQIGQAIPAMEEGGIVVEALSAVTAGDSVYIRFQNGNEGKFENASNADNFLIPNAVFTKSTAAATGATDNYTAIKFAVKGA